MITLAELELALRHDRAFGRLADTHLHRAVREDARGVIKGREAITAAWVALEPAPVTIAHDLGEMIAWEAQDGSRGHHWVWREAGMIVREIVVEHGAATTPAPYAPLGELRSGRGQFDAGPNAVVPPDWPDAARPLTDRLHRAWNGRAFDEHGPNWLVAICRRAPDATFLWERAIVAGDATALLWRMHGHADGQRLRLLGSSVFRGDGEDTVVTG